MFRKATITAVALVAIAAASTSASAQPGLSGLAQPSPSLGQASDIAQVGWRRGRPTDRTATWAP